MTAEPRRLEHLEAHHTADSNCSAVMYVLSGNKTVVYRQTIDRKSRNHYAHHCRVHGFKKSEPQVNSGVTFVMVVPVPEKEQGEVVTLLKRRNIHSRIVFDK